MSANLTVGVSAAPVITDKTTWMDAGNSKPQDDKLSSSQTNVRQVQSLKDLKMAKVQGESVSLSDQQLIKEIEKAIKAAEGPVTTLQFSIHKASNELQIKVFNKDTGELIREIPPEQTLNIVANLRKKAGIVVDERR